MLNLHWEGRDRSLSADLTYHRSHREGFLPFRFASAFLNVLHFHPFLLNNSLLTGKKNKNKKILQLVSTPNTDDKLSWKPSLKKH